jgi:hypothetical protein
MNDEKGNDYMDDDNNGGEMAQDSLKRSVLDSYIANYLSSVYKDKEKWSIEWMRLKDGSILIKNKSKDDRELIFHKFDIKDAVVEKDDCPKYKIDPKVREFIYFQEFCKKDKQYKLKYGLVGTENSMIVGLKVAFTKLVEARNQEELENFKRNIGKFEKAYYSTVLPYYNTFSGLYNLGLYQSGVYNYPFTYSNITPYYNTYYVPPVASSIVPTAPVVSQVPYTYNYPMISTSMYTLGSYYTPYTYSYLNPFTYVSPYTYSYYIKSVYEQDKPNTRLLSIIDQEDTENTFSSQRGVPMTFSESAKSYTRLVKSDVEEFDKFRNVKYIAPSKVSSIRDLSARLADQNMKSINIEKISNYLYKVEFEKQCIRQTHYYSFENDGLYNVTKQINVKII